jgi:hypothetical protein
MSAGGMVGKRTAFVPTVASRFALSEAPSHMHGFFVAGRRLSNMK